MGEYENGHGLLNGRSRSEKGSDEHHQSRQSGLTDLTGCHMNTGPKLYAELVIS
jgi:hypothetical protein